jgi:hypothetical protein
VASKPETEITLDKGTRVAVGLGLGGPIDLAAGVRVLHGLGADVREGAERVKGSAVFGWGIGFGM